MGPREPLDYLEQDCSLDPHRKQRKISFKRKTYVQHCGTYRGFTDQQVHFSVVETEAQRN